MFQTGLLTFLLLIHKIVAMSYNSSHPCFSNSLCEGKLEGKPDNYTEYYIYEPDKSMYYACARNNEDTKTFNQGCLKCPASFMYSKKCGQCLSKDDAKDENCHTEKQNNSKGDIIKCDVSDKCKNRTSGTFQYEGNPAYFYTCINETASLCQSCPSGLEYNAECNQCGRPGVKLYCNQKVQYQETINKGEKNPGRCNNTHCDNKEDGNYELSPNSTQYYQCANGMCYEAKCVGGLVYSKVCDKCEEKYIDSKDDCKSNEKVIECPESVPDCGQIIQEFEMDTPNCDIAKCEGKVDGNYEISNSSTKYYQCANDMCYKATCVEGLVFSKACDSCLMEYIASKDDCPDHNSKVKACPEDEPNCNQVIQEFEMDTSICDASNCDDKPNGNHELKKNSAKYYQCVNGTCYNANCPGDLVFSKVCESCESEYIVNKTNCPNFQKQQEEKEKKDEENDISKPVTTKAPRPQCPDNFCSKRDRMGKYHINKDNNKQRFYCMTEKVCYVELCPSGLVFKVLNPEVNGMMLCTFP